MAEGGMKVVGAIYEIETEHIQFLDTQRYENNTLC